MFLLLSTLPQHSFSLLCARNSKCLVQRNKFQKYFKTQIQIFITLLIVYLYKMYIHIWESKGEKQTVRWFMFRHACIWNDNHFNGYNKLHGVLFSSAIPEMFVNSDTLHFFLGKQCTTATSPNSNLKHFQKKHTKINAKPSKNVHL